jgi:hypothetical protein
MKAECFTANRYINAHCASNDRILFINPPVIETRYQWLRWNQPLDLLKLSSFFKKEIGCETRLFDFMLPKNGRVARTANRPDDSIMVDAHNYSLWRYGEPKEEFVSQLNRLLSKWRPTQIWVTSLTSYWWKGVRHTISQLKSHVPDARVVLYGQYPRLEKDHAQHYSFADALITDSINASNYSADFDLYTANKPAFCALDADSENWPEEAVQKFNSGINDFAFFNEDLLSQSKQLLPRLKLFQQRVNLKASNRHPKFHALMGLYPASLTDETALRMKEAGFAEFHFEQDIETEELDLDSYRRASEACLKAGLRLGSHTSAFLFIGLPTDKLEHIIHRMLNLLELLGSVILKPYTPTPESDIYNQYKDYLETKQIEQLSPHLFPFSKVNEISHLDYEELYTLAAALNEKVRGRAFDCFPGTLAYEMIKTSLEREVWKLGI